MPQQSIDHGNGNIIKFVLIILLVMWPLTSIICGLLLHEYKQTPHTVSTLEIATDLKLIRTQLRELQDRVNQIADKP